MLKRLWLKIREALISVLPVAIIVLILYFTPFVNLTPNELLVFIVTTLLLILGIALFNLGSDLAMIPMGRSIGSGLIKRKNIGLLVAVFFLFGVFITIAEPDTAVLAELVRAVIDKTFLVIMIGVGLGLFLVVGLFKMVFKRPFSMIITFFYLMMFAFVALVLVNGDASFLPLSFDSGGVTTGLITVPFVMALGVGVSMTIGGRNAEENSFGLIAFSLVGPVLIVLLIGAFIKDPIPYELADYSIASNWGQNLLENLWRTAKESLLALVLIAACFFIINFAFLKIAKDKIIRIIIGIVYTFIGLVLFLTAINVGYLPIGNKLGMDLANQGSAFLIICGFIIGFAVVLAEPAVHVLNQQVEEITNGRISKLEMMMGLSIGIGLSVGLSMLRIAFDFSILYYIIPGYILALALSFFVPPIYTSIAFDSGAVASGPLSVCFILPLAIGACVVLQGEAKVMSDAFGIVAMVAMTPPITIQLLGFRSVLATKVRERLSLRRVLSADDKQIIKFR